MPNRFIHYGKEFNLRHRFRVTLLLLVCCNFALGQTDTSRVLKQVKISTSAAPEVQSVSPAQQIHASDFVRYNALNVSDAIRDFSGVTVKDYGGIGGLKTVSVRSLGANHTAVEYDGVTITDAQNGQVDLGKITLENVTAITLFNGQPDEICRPARSFASASLLSIKSSESKFDSEKPYALSASFKTGSFGLVNPSLNWQQKITGKWSLTLLNAWQHANGRYRYKVDGDGSDTSAERQNGRIESLRTDAAVFWSRNDSNRFHVRFNSYFGNQGLPGAVIYYNPSSRQHLWNRDLFIQSGYDRKWERFHLLLNQKISSGYTRYLDPDFLNQAGQLDQRYKQTEAYNSIALSYAPRPNLEIGYSNDLTFNQLRTNLYQYAYPKRYTLLNVLSARAHAHSFNLQASLLNTYITEDVQTGTASSSRMVWSPAVSASWQPFEHKSIEIRAFYKDIFRNPTFNDLYYSRIGNRSLKPEFAHQTNLGLTYRTFQHGALNFIKLTADAYFNRVTNKIIALPNKDLFSWTILNLGKVEIRGLDAGLRTELQMSHGFKIPVSANYTFQDAVDVTDPGSSVYLDQIPYTPRHTVALNSGIRNERFGIYYNLILSSPRYFLAENLPENRTPGFSVSDMSFSYKLSAGVPVSLSAEVSNLFNQSYSFIRSFPMPGRSVRFSIQINF